MGQVAALVSGTLTGAGGRHVKLVLSRLQTHVDGTGALRLVAVITHVVVDAAKRRARPLLVTVRCDGGDSATVLG